MKKQLMIVGIIFILLAVGLSGCNQSSQTTEDNDKVELVNYNVETYSQPIGNHTFEWKEINGTVKNIGGTLLNKIVVNIKFYDSNDTLLKTKTDSIFNIANSYTGEFMVEYPSTESYYENVDWDNIKFEFSVS